MAHGPKPFAKPDEGRPGELSTRLISAAARSAVSTGGLLSERTTSRAARRRRGRVVGVASSRPRLGDPCFSYALPP